MKFIPGQDWRDKIATLRNVAANIKARNSASRFTPVPLSDAQRERVESVTRFERYMGHVLKRNGSEMRVTNR